MNKGERGATVRARVEAPAERIWVIVTNLSRHPDIAGSREPQKTRLISKGPIKAGSRFESRQKWHGVQYDTHSEVTAFEEYRLLGWTTNSDAYWEFRLAPDVERAYTWVIHGYRWKLNVPWVLRMILHPLFDWRHGQNIRGMVGSLHNLAHISSASPPLDLEVSEVAPDWRPVSGT